MTIAQIAHVAGIDESALLGVLSSRAGPAPGERQITGPVRPQRRRERPSAVLVIGVKEQVVACTASSSGCATVVGGRVESPAAAIRRAWVACGTSGARALVRVTACGLRMSRAAQLIAYLERGEPLAG